MYAPDNDPAEELDRRDLVALNYADVVNEIDSRAAAVEAYAQQHGLTVADDVLEQMELARYAQDVLLHGNFSGRCNPTITLPIPWRILDVIAVIGRPDEAAPGSDAAWRAMRRHYDSSQGGRQFTADGRTR